MFAVNSFFRFKDLQDLKRRSVVARGLITQYGTQVSNLYQSSTTAIVQVNAALERSLALGNEVRAALDNVTQVHQGSLAAVIAARNSVSTTNHLHEHAQRMLHVASKFETVSLQAQASADKALLGVPGVLNTTHEIIQQVSMVNESSSSALSTATEALQLGSKVHNLSASEQQVWFLLNVSFLFTSLKSRRSCVYTRFQHAFRRATVLAKYWLCASGVLLKNFKVQSKNKWLKALFIYLSIG